MTEQEPGKDKTWRFVGAMIVLVAGYYFLHAALSATDSAIASVHDVAAAIAGEPKPGEPNCYGVQELPQGESSVLRGLGSDEMPPGTSKIMDEVDKRLAGPYGADKYPGDLQGIARIEKRIQTLRDWAATQAPCVGHEYSRWLDYHADKLDHYRAQIEFKDVPKPPTVQ